MIDNVYTQKEVLLIIHLGTYVFVNISRIIKFKNYEFILYIKFKYKYALGRSSAGIQIVVWSLCDTIHILYTYWNI